MRKLIQAGCADITNQIDIGSCSHKPITRGGYGSVYHGMLQDGTEVAIKCMETLEEVCWLGGHKIIKVRKPVSSLRLVLIGKNVVLQRAAREVYTWSKCDHPNVLPLLGMARFHDYIAMVSPWQNHGRLDAYISRCQYRERLELVSRAILVNKSYRINLSMLLVHATR
jgi:serine/threonine protein kinase